MTTNATVEARHKDEAKLSWINPDDMDAYERRFAQALANLEKARAENADLTNRLAEIDRIARHIGRDCQLRMADIRDLASGHTPPPCPGCAAKEEAMAEIAEIVDAFWLTVSDKARIATLTLPYRRPPADPVADALKALDALVLFHKSGGYEGAGEDTDLARCEAALAELKSRLPAIEAKESQHGA